MWALMKGVAILIMLVVIVYTIVDIANRSGRQD
jgi:hypothetical protein